MTLMWMFAINRIDILKNTTLNSLEQLDPLLNSIVGSDSQGQKMKKLRTNATPFIFWPCLYLQYCNHKLLKTEGGGPQLSPLGKVILTLQKPKSENDINLDVCKKTGFDIFKNTTLNPLKQFDPLFNPLVWRKQKSTK